MGRGRQFFIKWNDNIAESVVIDLYKGGTFLKTIATSSNAGAYQWNPDPSLPPGNDYTIKIRSSTDATLSNVSAAAFGLDVPYINPGSLLRLPDGRTQFSLTAPGATQAKVQGSANLADWTDLQTLPVTSGSATFTDSETGSTKRFYRLYMAP